MDAQEQQKSDLHEMQKPLARYADDTDLENLLKSKIRDGDPMLEYISKNKGSRDNSPDGVRHGKSILFIIVLPSKYFSFTKVGI